MHESPEFKRAAIDWVLTHGTCESMTTSTRLALADLAVRGVDYEASDTPSFRTVALDSGDSFNEATYGEAFACTIYAQGRDPHNIYDAYDFHVGDDDIKTLLLHQMILGVLAAADQGDTDWKARADQREIERLQRTRANQP